MKERLAGSGHGDDKWIDIKPLRPKAVVGGLLDQIAGNLNSMFRRFGNSSVVDRQSDYIEAVLFRQRIENLAELAPSPDTELIKPGFFK